MYYVKIITTFAMRNCSPFLMEINQEKLYSLFLLSTKVFYKRVGIKDGAERQGNRKGKGRQCWNFKTIYGG
jgi:hypothetical protein